MINNDVRYVDRNGDGATTVFSFSPLVVFAATDLKVYLIDEADDTDDGTLLSQGTSSTTYSVSVAAFPGTGSITYPASGGSPLATGKRLRIIAAVPLIQDSQFEHQGGMTPKVIERLLDKVVVRLQTAYEMLDRALLVPRSSPSTPAAYLATAAASAISQATTAASNASSSASAASTSAANASASASAASSSASAAAASAVTAAAAADNLKATSTTSLTIGTGTKTFVTQSGKAFQTGGWVVTASNANAANFMFGQITSYVGTSLEVNVVAIGGSGTLADWNIAVSGIQGVQGPAGAPGAGTGDVVGPASAVANRIVTFNGTTGKLVQDSGQLITTAMSTLAGLTPAADRIPIFTGASSAGLQIVTTDTKSILAAANFAAVLSLLGLVRPADGRVWYSASGVLASDAELTYDASLNQLKTGQIEVDSTNGLLAAPTSPAVRFGALTDQRAWPAMRTADHAAVRMQPLIGGMWYKMWSGPTISAGVGSHFSTGGGVLGQGAVATPTLASTNWRTRNFRVTRQSTSSAGSRGGYYTEVKRWFRSATAGLGGFRAEYIFALETDTTGFQCFVGVTSDTTPVTGDPSAMLNTFGIGFDASDAAGSNWQVMHNDGSGTATRVASGMNRNATSAFRLVLECPVGNASTLYWHLTDLNSGTVVSGSVTTNLPTADTFLIACMMVRNGAIAAVAGIELYSMILDAPLN